MHGGTGRRQGRDARTHRKRDAPCIACNRARLGSRLGRGCISVGRAIRSWPKIGPPARSGKLDAGDQHPPQGFRAVMSEGINSRVNCDPTPHFKAAKGTRSSGPATHRSYRSSPGLCGSYLPLVMVFRRASSLRRPWHTARAMSASFAHASPISALPYSSHRRLQLGHDLIRSFSLGIEDVSSVVSAPLSITCASALSPVAYSTASSYSR